MTERVSALLAVDDALVAAHQNVYGDHARIRSIALADALASSPAWARLREHARLVVRPESGLYGILGSVDNENRSLVDAFGSHVTGLLERLLPVSYREVEDASFELAAKLRLRLTDDEIRDCQIVPIARGGLIVAGVLAYALGTPPAQPRGRPGKNKLTLLVDDCAISGTRLQGWLRAHPETEVLAAILHAHPDLCRLLEEANDSLRACVSARALRDHAPRLPDYTEWKERWRRRSPDDPWTGNPDHVCYPWNEPDSAVWNTATRRADDGWRVAPPSWCLKNRASSRSADVQVCEPADGPSMPATDVVWATIDNLILVAGREESRSLALRGSAAAMWRVLVAIGDPDDAVTSIASNLGIERKAAGREMSRFVSFLRDRGLIRG